MLRSPLVQLEDTLQLNHAVSAPLLTFPLSALLALLSELCARFFVERVALAVDVVLLLLHVRLVKVPLLLFLVHHLVHVAPPSACAVGA